MDMLSPTSPTAIYTSPIFAGVSGNIWHHDSSSSGPSLPPAPPPPPIRMSPREVNEAIIDLADRVQGDAKLSTRAMLALLPTAPAASVKLLQLALHSSVVANAIADAVTDDGWLHFNAWNITARDLAALKAQVTGKAGPTLEAVRAAIATR